MSMSKVVKRGDYLKMIHTIELAMKRTIGYPSTLWYRDELISAIINEGVRLGYLYRPATSQVQWTDYGVRTLCDDRKSKGIICRCSNCFTQKESRLWKDLIKKTFPGG